MSEENETDTFLVRVRRAVSSTGRRVENAPSKLMKRVRRAVDERIAPAIEQKARQALLKLAEPENARQLQETLAGFAQMAMRAGFRSDPPAKLLFDFVDELEKRHSREEVLQVVLEHAVTYESDLLEMLLAAGPAGSTRPGLEQLRERAGDRLLTLLCSLVALDCDEPPPTAEEAQVDYFERAPIDDRFRPLARMATGDRSAFDTAEARTQTKESRLGGILRRLTGEKTTAMARFVPSLNDPVTRFLTMSYLFFLQSYLVRAMIEGLPAALEMASEFDREQQVEDDDILEIGD